MNTQYAKGVTLIHVMVLMALLGAILVSEIQKRQSFSDTHAFYYTIAQTHMALNNAYGEFNASGSWPSNAGNCAIDPPVLNNGWGAELQCEFETTGVDASTAREYRLIQFVHEDMAHMFEEAFRGDGVSVVSGYSAPPGFVTYRVRVDRSGGAEQRVDFAVLTGSGSPATVDKVVCESGVSEEFVALGGMEGHVYMTQTVSFSYVVWPFSFCASTTLSPYNAKWGIRLLSQSSASNPLARAITYNMYRQRYNATATIPPGIPYPLFIDGSPIGAPSIVDNTISTVWGCGADYSADDSLDGHFNANYQSNNTTIEASLFQFCK